MGNLQQNRQNSIATLGNDALGDRSERGQNLAGIAMRESAAGPLIALPQVAKRLRVSRITVWRMVKAGQFPAPLSTAKRRTVWRALDVNAWCKANAAHFERVIARILPAALHR
jgi:predicted DNA-binding transcriptional regulator AlpA